MAHILVVEDEPLISALTQDWLSELGHSVVGPAADLASGLKLAATPIVDVSLGRHSGYPVAEALAARVFRVRHRPWRGRYRPRLARPADFGQAVRFRGVPTGGGGGASRRLIRASS